MTAGICRVATSHTNTPTAESGTITESIQARARVGVIRRRFGRMFISNYRLHR